MLSAYELFGFMSPALSSEIVESTFVSNRDLYRATLAAVADAKKVRPAFLEKKPRSDRHKDMVEMLSRPRMNLAAATLLRGWLMKSEQAMLIDFLNSLKIEHKDGAVEDLPATVDDELLKTAVNGLLERFPREKVAIYLNAFNEMNEVQWKNLADMLGSEERLQLVT
jgi:hypothetical protein